MFRNVVWHLLLVHDDYGKHVGERIGRSVADVRHLQVLTEDDQRRVHNLGKYGDGIVSSGDSGPALK